jgi:hypothetical protein
MIAILPLLLAAAPVAASVAGDGAAMQRPVARLATATVTIVQAERIAPFIADTAVPKPDRQIRQRDAMPLVEFY